MAAGATACEVRPLDDGSVLIHATFDRSSLSPDEIMQMQTELSHYGVLAPGAKLKACTVAQEDWLEKFKVNFKSFPVGERLLICPPWDRDSVQATTGDRKLLVVEPAMAFGTGLHATTQFCLRSLEGRTNRMRRARYRHGQRHSRNCRSLARRQCKNNGDRQRPYRDGKRRRKLPPEWS